MTSSKEFSPINRRSLLQYGLSSAVGATFLKPFAAKAETTSVSRGKLAIIGAGIGGVSTAYFCDPEWSIDVFEALPRLGGHGATVAIEEEGQHVAVDLGAAFFNPLTHPIYWSFLYETGLISDKNKDLVYEAPGSLTVFDSETLKPLFSTAHPLENPFRATGFLIFAGAARDALNGGIAWDLTIGEWVDSLLIADDFKYNILLPWLASFSCLDVEGVRKLSAIAQLTPFARTFEEILKKPSTYNAAVGLGGIVDLVAGQCKNASFHIDSPVQGLEEVDGKWFISTSKGRQGPYDAVVVNAPPHASSKFFANVPWASDLANLLSRREYYPTKVIAHRDPVNMPANPKYWAVNNAAVTGQEHAEATVYVGMIHPKLPSGKAVQVFKSWTGKRPVEPKDVIATHDFQHPIVSPAVLEQTKELYNWQGKNNLYFAGHFTVVSDSHDTALFSGLEVSRLLSPSSPRVTSFDTRLKAEGKDKVSYTVV